MSHPVPYKYTQVIMPIGHFLAQQHMYHDVSQLLWNLKKPHSHHHHCWQRSANDCANITTLLTNSQSKIMKREYPHLDSVYKMNGSSLKIQATQASQRCRRKPSSSSKLGTGCSQSFSEPLGVSTQRHAHPKRCCRTAQQALRLLGNASANISFDMQCCWRYRYYHLLTTNITLIRDPNNPCTHMVQITEWLPATLRNVRWAYQCPIHLQHLIWYWVPRAKSLQLLRVVSLYLSSFTPNSLTCIQLELEYNWWMGSYEGTGHDIAALKM